MTRVMCFGTFDILHPGHIKFLRNARNLGDELYVVISRDARRRAITGKTPVHSQKERMTLVGALEMVTKAIPGSATDILAPLRAIKPAIIILGHDQIFGVDRLEAWVRAQKIPPRIVRLPAYQRPRYSSTRVREIICKNARHDAKSS